MTWERLLQKKEQFCQIREHIPKEALESFDKSFDVEYAHNSTAIEGNTLTLIQTKAVLEDGISVGGKTLREIYEVVNHSKAFQFVKQCVAEGKPLDENILHEVGTHFSRIITIEDGVIRGGLGSAVLEYMSDHGFFPKVTRMGLPDYFVEHGTVEQLRQIVGIDRDAIVSQLRSISQK